jgi:hypothetical protein
LTWFAWADPASAAINLGMTGPPSACTGDSFLYFQTQPPTDTTYVSPGAGTITSWSHQANGSAGQTVGLIVLRKVSDPLTYTQIAHDGPRAMTVSALNTFPVNIPVQRGDVIGLNSGNVGTTSAHGCFLAIPFLGLNFAYHNGAVADNVPTPFTQSINGVVNVSATVEPSNQFGIGAATRNAKRGTATLSVSTQWPGEVIASGSGAVVSSARESATLNVPGEVTLTVAATGKAKKKLKRKGKVSLPISVQFSPTGGAPATQSTTVALKKKLKKRK